MQQINCNLNNHENFKLFTLSKAGKSTGTNTGSRL